MLSVCRGRAALTSSATRCVPPTVARASPLPCRQGGKPRGSGGPAATPARYFPAVPDFRRSSPPAGGTPHCGAAVNANGMSVATAEYNRAQPLPPRPGARPPAGNLRLPHQRGVPGPGCRRGSLHGDLRDVPRRLDQHRGVSRAESLQRSDPQPRLSDARRPRVRRAGVPGGDRGPCHRARSALAAARPGNAGHRRPAEDAASVDESAARRAVGQLLPRRARAASRRRFRDPRRFDRGAGPTAAAVSPGGTFARHRSRT